VVTYIRCLLEPQCVEDDAFRLVRKALKTASAKQSFQFMMASQMGKDAFYEKQRAEYMRFISVTTDMLPEFVRQVAAIRDGGVDLNLDSYRSGVKQFLEALKSAAADMRPKVLDKELLDVAEGFHKAFDALGDLGGSGHASASSKYRAMLDHCCLLVYSRYDHHPFGKRRCPMKTIAQCKTSL
jgi:hypothetical protein